MGLFSPIQSWYWIQNSRLFLLLCFVYPILICFNLLTCISATHLDRHCHGDSEKANNKQNNRNKQWVVFLTLSGNSLEKSEIAWYTTQRNNVDQSPQ